MKTIAWGTQQRNQEVFNSCWLVLMNWKAHSAPWWFVFLGLFSFAVQMKLGVFLLLVPRFGMQWISTAWAALHFWAPDSTEVYPWAFSSGYSQGEPDFDSLLHSPFIWVLQSCLAWIIPEPHTGNSTIIFQGQKQWERGVEKLKPHKIKPCKKWEDGEKTTNLVPSFFF